MQQHDRKAIAYFGLSLMAATLLIIWPINGTTGLKNFLIFMGAMLSIWIISSSAKLKNRSIKIKTTLIFLFFLWIFFQSNFISPFPDQAQRQLLNVWLPTAFAALIGYTLGSHETTADSRNIIKIALLSLPFIYFANYLSVCIASNRCSIPIFNTDLGWYGDKTKIIFFGLLALATSLHLLFKNIQLKETRGVFIYAACALASYLSFILVGSKSGVMQGAILFFLALLFVLRNHVSRRAFLILIPIGIIFGSAGIWQIKNDKGWANFIHSIQAGIDIEKYHNWKDYPASGLPVVDEKYQVQESAYLRASGIALGVKCLLTQPLGHGNLSEPLKRTRDVCELATRTEIFTTYSALLDFVLVTGLPGVTLLLGIFIAAFSTKATSADDPLPLNKIATLSIFLTWVFSEISDTHYYESTFFILSMLISAQRNTIRDPKNVVTVG